jgi:hypothetical protein
MHIVEFRIVIFFLEGGECGDRVSLCSSCWLQTHALPDSAPGVLVS